VVFLVQVVHKAGSSSQVHGEDYGVDDGEAEAEVGVGATIEAEEGDGAATEAEGDEEEDDVTPFEMGGEINEGEENEEVLS
jgi:hypothetical protein